MMSRRFTYWADLETVALHDEGGELSGWVHALPVGEYKHPAYGKLRFTLDRMRKFATNVKSRIRGTDLDVDYDHKEKDTKAAGWIKDAEAKPDGLWVFVEWTREASQLIRDKAFRYFSAEYLDEWEDASGTKHKDVLLGGALTNRPFMKQLVPLNFNELFDNEGEKVDRAQLAQLLGLSEDASEEDIKAKITELSDEKPKLDLSKLVLSKDDDGKLKATHPDLDGEYVFGLPDGVTVVSSDDKETDEELAALAEKNPTIARMLNEHKNLTQSVSRLEAANRLSEVNVQLNEIGKEENKALPPVVVDGLRKVMVRLPKELSDEIANSMAKLVKTGVVQLGEVAQTTTDGKQESDAITQFLGAIDKTMEKNDKLGYREATDIVAREQPTLFAEYESAMRQASVQLR